MLNERIRNKHLLRLIKRFLKNGYLEKGLEHSPDKGTPQGGVISPVLANIYLHYVLDLWFTKIVKKHVKGFAGIVRYADDYIICACYQKDAEAILKALKGRLNKFFLELAEDKTKLIGFGRFARAKALKYGRKAETFDFLGFTHFNDKDRKGGFRVGRKTVRKRFVVKQREIYQYLKSVRTIKPKLWWQTLSSKLRGHYQYYGVSGNYHSIQRFYEETLKGLHKWLNRRSQKKSMNWEKFWLYLERFPLPKPRIYHNLYLNRSYRGEY